MKNTAITALLIMTFLLSACTSPRRHIARITNQIPIAQKLVEDNEEMFKILLEARVRLKQYNSDRHISGDYTDTISRIDIGISNDLAFGVYVAVPGSNDYRLHDGTTPDILTHEEEEVIRSVLLNKLEGKCNERRITIEEDGIRFRYLNSGRVNLFIENPAREVPETYNLLSYDYAIKVNDDWSIYIFWNMPQ